MWWRGVLIGSFDIKKLLQPAVCKNNNVIKVNKTERRSHVISNTVWKYICRLRNKKICAIFSTIQPEINYETVKNILSWLWKRFCRFTLISLWFYLNKMKTKRKSSFVVSSLNSDVLLYDCFINCIARAFFSFQMNVQKVEADKKIVYSLSRDNLKASAVLIKSTNACSSNRLPVTFKLWLSIANLNADCTSSVPCSKIAPVSKIKKSETSH